MMHDLIKVFFIFLFAVDMLIVPFVIDVSRKPFTRAQAPWRIFFDLLFILSIAFYL